MTQIKILNSSEFFKVENIYCVGRNYTEHIRKTNPEGTEIPQEPLIFFKPNSAVVISPASVSVPAFKSKKISENLQPEIELVIAAGKDGTNISAENAADYILGYAVGIDFTLRDLQTDAKQKGLPWSLSKGFIGSAALSDVRKKEELESVNNLALNLRINGELKQSGNASEMIFDVNYLLHYISCIFSLKKGDLIFTGTPEGVQTLQGGDFVEAEIEKIGNLTVKIL